MYRVQYYPQFQVYTGSLEVYSLRIRREYWNFLEAIVIVEDQKQPKKMSVQEQ
jgi:hypothetical protein